MSANSKRGHALTGDLVELTHPTLELNMPFSSHVEVVFGGVTHQVRSTSGIEGFSFEHVTGEFTVNGHRGFIIESIDTVATQATHVYLAVVQTPNGALSVHSYQSVEQALSLIGAVRPQATRLGVVIDPDDSVEISGSPRIALQIGPGVLEVSPLTADVVDQLPDWSGSHVTGGELFGGYLNDQAPYLTLVSPSSRALLLLGAQVDLDKATTTMSELSVTWTT